MGTKARISAEMHLDNLPFKEGLKNTKTATEKWKGEVEKIKVNLNVNVAGAGRWAEMGGKIQVAAMAMRGLGSAARVASSFFKADENMESLVRSLAVVTRDSQSLKSQMSDLGDLAAKPGIDLTTAIQGSAALQSVGMSAKESRDALDQWSNAVAAAGGGAQDLQGVLVQLRQMMSAPSVEMTDLKPIMERIPQMGAIAAKLEDLKGKPREFVGAATQELAKLDRVSAGARESVDNLRDSFNRWMVSSSGGKVAAVGSAFMNYGSNVLDNGFRAKDFEKLGGDIMDPWKTNSKTPVESMQPSAETIAARKKAWEESEKATREGREKLADRALKASREELDIEEDIARAKAKGDPQEQQALEEKLFLLQNVAKAAKELGVSEAFVTERLRARIDAEQTLQSIAARAAGEKEQKAADIARLRSRGQNRKADKLEEENTRDERIKDLLTRDPEMKRKDAEDIADSDALTRKDADFRQKHGGRNRLHGVNVPNTVSGLDDYPFTTDAGLPPPRTPVLDSDPFRQRRMKPPETPADGEARPAKGGAAAPPKASQAAEDTATRAIIAAAAQNTQKMLSKMDDLRQAINRSVGETLKPVNQ